ncbi:hypothetical protein B484DRAFT_403593, partial [Ochromonadaceae sp. CCMP2298]
VQRAISRIQERHHTPQEQARAVGGFSGLKALFEQERHGDADELLVKFNVHENAPALVHEGHLPTSDMGTWYVRFQVLLRPEGGPPTFLGGGYIRLLDMLTRAHAGQCMEVAFTQRQSAFHTGAAVQAQAPFSKSTEAPGAPGSPGDGVTDVTDVTDGVVAFDSGDEAVAAACGELRLYAW